MTMVHKCPYLGYGGFPMWNGAGMWQLLMLHYGPTEFVYYWQGLALVHFPALRKHFAGYAFDTGLSTFRSAPAALTLHTQAEVTVPIRSESAALSGA